jgi:hypothetical protein
MSTAPYHRHSDAAAIIIAPLVRQQPASNKPILHVDAVAIEPYIPAAAPRGVTYQTRRNGLLFRNEQGEPFAFLVANTHQERFFVSCHQTTEGLRYLYGLADRDARTLGIGTYGYGAAHQLATAWWDTVSRRVDATPPKPS